MRSLDAQAKARLIEEFEACLERCEPGDDDATDDPVDLRTLLAEMAALKNEVRLEARQFRTMADELRSAGEALRAQNERLVRDLDRVREQAGDAQRQTEQKLLLALLDLRDRLQAGADAAAAARPRSLFARLMPGATRVARSLGEGTAITLRRLDEVLASYRVRPLEALGQRLDPERMRAVGVESAPGVAEGVVLRELRRGYMHGGELLRAAEVIVGKTAS